MEQYPAVLYQVLQEIESEGYVCREVYCDTSSVNLSQSVEEVAEMFKVKIIPISGGTPQELAYAESAVRTLGQMSRSLMLGAPHLPLFIWGMSDLYAAVIHRTIPQKNKNSKSPFEITTGRPPNRELLFIHVFGCPCQYEPAYDVLHKRAAKTEWGWFVGVQWPMVLVLRPDDHKVLSISRKKVYCHELMYAKFDPDTQSKPQIDFKDFNLDAEEIGCAIQKAIASGENHHESTTAKGYLARSADGIPSHVLSVKSMSDSKRNQHLLFPEQREVPAQMVKIYHEAEGSGESGKFEVPETLKIQRDLLLEDIARRKTSQLDDTLSESILKVIQKVDREKCDAPTRQMLKRQSKPKSINTDNVVEAKRMRKEIVSEKIINMKSKASMETKHLKPKPLPRVKKAPPKHDPGDRVKILTTRFGKGYAKGKPKWTWGKVESVGKDKIVDVRWDSSEGQGEVMKAHLVHLVKVSPIIVMMEEISNKMRWDGWPFKSASTMLPVLEIGSVLAQSNLNDSGNWPRDFIEALIRPDWRNWVDAVKSENESWDTCDACSEVPYHDIAVGASVIPLGELFTIKRSGKYKFRQIALGNLLKEGKDYGETFASTVSGDGLRWFCSLAVTSGREVRGWDATTGYLQTTQRVPVYAYLPSHHGYSNLEYEELAKLRMTLIEVLKTDGIKGIKEFSRKIKQERRVRPKTVLQLKRSVYGIPDAGQSFSMFMQGLHIKQCGMIQSDIDPCIYYKIFEDQDVRDKLKKKVTGFLVVISWVDDCRYFGTKDLVEEYEKTVSANCKCTMEGISKEFVSIQLNHDLAKRTMELTQEDYWDKAVIRFKEFFGEKGPKIRLVPLSPLDEKSLQEPSEDEIKAAEHLPYPNVLGVVQYPSSYIKLEMKYAMSVLSRHRAKWGITHFKVLLKSLEYG